jgi:hypothetical protein
MAAGLRWCKQTLRQGEIQYQLLLQLALKVETPENGEKKKDSARKSGLKFVQYF